LRTTLCTRVKRLNGGVPGDPNTYNIQRQSGEAAQTAESWLHPDWRRRRCRRGLSVEVQPQDGSAHLPRCSLSCRSRFSRRRALWSAVLHRQQAVVDTQPNPPNFVDSRGVICTGGPIAGAALRNSEFLRQAATIPHEKFAIVYFESEHSNFFFAVNENAVPGLNEYAYGSVFRKRFQTSSINPSILTLSNYSR